MEFNPVSCWKTEKIAQTTTALVTLLLSELGLLLDLVPGEETERRRA